MRSNRAVVIFYHFLFWLVLICVPPITLRVIELLLGGVDIISPVILVYLVLLVGIFYCNAYFLLPRFLFRRRYLSYVLLSILLLMTVSSFNTWVEYVLDQLNGYFVAHLAIYFFLGIIPLVLSTAYRIIEINIKQQRIKQEMENESIRSELSLLRSQVSPHFMFNVLNTLVALIRQRSENLEPAVIKLSSLMRYMLYESDEEKVSLQTEIEYLRSYIDIQRLRFGDKVDILFEYPQQLPELMLEPMLLIPLVENAFKHGVNVIRDPALQIKLQLNEGALEMRIANRYRELPQSDKEAGNSGIGLANLRRRLDILYPGTHELHLTKEAGWFKAYLHLNLHYNSSANASPANRYDANMLSVFKITKL